MKSSWNKTHNNCGMGEICNVQYHPKDPKEVLVDCFFRQMYGHGVNYNHPSVGLMMFSGVVSPRLKYTERLKKYIEDNNLGTVTVSEGALNPNHPRRRSAQIKAYVWKINHEALREWAKENKPPPPPAPPPNPYAYW